MRQLERNKRPVAVAQRYSLNGVETYGTPIRVRVNFRNTRSAAGMDGLGEAVEGSLAITADPQTATQFREFDKVYVFVDTPIMPDNGDTADYVVEAIMPGLNGTDIRLKRVIR